MPPSHGYRSLWELFQSSKPTAGLDPSPRHTGFVGPIHHAQEIPVTEVICFHMVIFWDPSFAAFFMCVTLHLQAQALKNHELLCRTTPLGLGVFVTVSISGFSSFNIMVRFLIFLLNTSLNCNVSVPGF